MFGNADLTDYKTKGVRELEQDEDRGSLREPRKVGRPGAEDLTYGTGMEAIVQSALRIQRGFAGRRRERPLLDY